MAHGTRDALSTRAALILAALCLVGFGAIAALVMHAGTDGGTAFDDAWNAFTASIHTPLLAHIALVLNIVGGTIASAMITAIVAIILLVRRRPWEATLVVSSVVFTALIVQIVKHLVARPRPEDMMVTSDFGSFPSGHSANAVALVMALSLLTRNVTLHILGGVYVLLMLFSRTYLHAHWLTDVAAGGLLGASVALLIWALLRPQLVQRSAAEAA